MSSRHETSEKTYHRDVRSWHRLVALATLASCGSEGVNEAFCVEEHVTIDQGLYGRVAYQTDVSPQTNPPTPVANEPIEILDAPNGTTVAATTSKTLGVFQSPLGEGTYALCYPSAPCITFTIGVDQLVRADLLKGFGTAWVVTPPARCAGN